MRLLGGTPEAIWRTTILTKDAGTGAVVRRLVNREDTTGRTEMVDTLALARLLQQEPDPCEGVGARLKWSVDGSDANARWDGGGKGNASPHPETALQYTARDSEVRGRPEHVGLIDRETGHTCSSWQVCRPTAPHKLQREAPGLKGGATRGAER